MDETTWITLHWTRLTKKDRSQLILAGVETFPCSIWTENCQEAAIGLLYAIIPVGEKEGEAIKTALALCATHYKRYKTNTEQENVKMIEPVLLKLRP